MINGKNLKKRITNGKWLGLYVTVTSLIPAVALAGNGGLSATSIMIGIGLAWAITAALTLSKPKEGLMLTALFAIGVSAYLGQQHFSTAPALCDAGDLFSCSTVNKSEYSVLAGIPIAFLGMGHYLSILLLSFFSNKEEYAAAPAFLKITTGFSVLYSIILAYLSATAVGAWCLFCISLYGFNAITAIGAMKLSKQQPSDMGAFEGKAFGTAAMSMIAVVIVANMVYSSDATSTEKSGSSAKVDIMSIVEAVNADLPLDGSEPLLGAVSAPIQLVEFADFECPHCGMVAPEIKKLVQNNPKVNLRFKHYPLSSICNPAIGRVAHENACLAAKAADCGHKQGKFWEMNRLIFKNQNYLSAKDIAFLAEQVGLEMTDFNSCLAGTEMDAGIQSDIKAAETVNVTGTPSIFIKGIGEQDKWYRLTSTVSELEKALQ